MIEVVVDVETTGLDPRLSCIWSVAAVPIVDGEVLESQCWSSLVMPVAPHFTTAHQAVVKRVSGLSDAELLKLFDAPHRVDVANALAEWLRDMGPLDRILAYNAPFDRSFLAVEPWALALGSAQWSCVMQPAAQRVGWNRIKLGDALEKFGVTPPDGESHTARVDAIAAARLWLALGGSTK